MLSRLVVTSSIAALALATATAIGQVIGSFSLAISPVSQTVKLGDPIRIDVILRNESRQLLSVFQDKSHNASFLYSFEVLDANGTRQCMTEEFAASKDSADDCPNAKPSSKVVVTMQSGYTIQIEPGAKVNDSTDLAKLYNLKSVGIYTVKVGRRDTTTNKIVRSNEATIEVVNK